MTDAAVTGEGGGGEGQRLIDDQKLRTAVAQAVQRGGGNAWLAADHVLLGPVAALIAQARADGVAEEWAVRFQTEGHDVYSHFNVNDEEQARRQAVSTSRTRAWIVRRTVTDWTEVPS